MENKSPSVGKVMASFIDNPAIAGREDKFLCLNVSIASVIDSWKESLFAHEWVKSDGTLKKPAELSDTNRQKRLDVEKALNEGRPLVKPVLGLGMLDNVEIGSGKDVLMTLASLSLDSLPVHIPKSHADDFKLFLR